MERSLLRKPPSPRQSKSNALLACRQCQRRKIKCDRKSPCGQCQLSDLPCQSSTRKKRSAKPQPHRSNREQRHDGVRGRVARLERMMETMQAEYAENRESTDCVAQPEPEVGDLKLRSKYVAGDFWASLVGEVEALKEALDEDAELSESDYHESPASHELKSRVGESIANVPNTIDFVLCPPGRIHQIPDALIHPDKPMQNFLANAYMEYVDRPWKVFHRPSFLAFSQLDQPYLGYPPSDPCNQALKASVFFAAIHQLSEVDCQELLQQDRVQMLEQLQRNAEACLIYADIFKTDRLAAVQALVVYVATLRKIDSSHRSWLLFALVERLGRALNLDKERPHESFFLTELKRRVWQHICLLDTFFALDRGTAPIISPGSFSTLFPSNINDADLHEGSEADTVISRDGEVTDMTLALAVQELCHIRHRLEKPVDSARDDSWRGRLEYVKTCHEQINRKYVRCCDENVLMHRYVIRVNKIMQAMNLLDVVHPLQQPVNARNTPIAPAKAFELALDVLRCSHELWQDSELNRWRRLEWIQWHALAIVLAGLCSSQVDLATDEAWFLVECTFVRSSNHIADATSGKLWLPLRRLHHRALMLRKSAVPASEIGGEVNTITIGSAPLIPAPTSAPSWLENNPESIYSAPYSGEQMLNDETFVAAFWNDWNSVFADAPTITAQVPQWLDMVNQYQ